MDEDILEVANQMQINIEAEADAIHKYDDAIKIVLATQLDEETKTIVINNITEIIADELNHMQKLKETYTLLTGIEQNEN